MSLLKMKLKAAVLLGIAGILMFVGGAWAATDLATITVTAAGNLTGINTPGGTLQLTAAGLDSEDPAGTVYLSQTAWSSSSIAVATVNSNGLVTAVSNGTVVISAKNGTDGGLGTDITGTISLTITGQVQPGDGITIRHDLDDALNVVAENFKVSEWTLKISAGITGTIAGTETPDTSLRFQWFKGKEKTANVSDTMLTSVGKDSTYVLPQALAVGTHYYYSRVTSTFKGANALDAVISHVITVTVKARPSITIDTEPGDSIGDNALVEASISSSGVLVVGASLSNPGSVTSSLAYQWFETSSGTGYSGTPVADANAASFEIPTGLMAGWHYYYCQVSAPYAVSKFTRIAVIQVNNPQGTDRQILPQTATVNINDAQIQYTRPTSSNKLRITLSSSLVTSTPALTPAQTFKVVRIKFTRTDVGLPEYNGDTTGQLPTGISAWNGVDSAGTYRVEFTVESANYKTTKTVSFVVEKRDLEASGLNVSVKAPADSIYNGSVKAPSVTISEGTGTNAYVLRVGEDYTIVQGVGTEWVNAGLVEVTINGAGNYKGTLKKTYIIRKKKIGIDVAGTTISPKPYDGLAALPAASISVAFSGLISGETLTLEDDFGISGQAFANVNVGTAQNVAGITVTLDTVNSIRAKNYTFGESNANPVITTTFSKTAAITKVIPVVGNFAFTIPQNRLFTGEPQDIGNVTWKVNASGTTGAIKTLYRNKVDGAYPEETAPVEVGTYEVTVNVTGSNNYSDAAGIFLGDYSIGAAKAPTVTTVPAAAAPGANADTTVWVGMPLVLKAEGLRPDSVTVRNAADSEDSTLYYKSGTLTYQWYKYTKNSAGDITKIDTLKNSGATASYTLPQPLVEGVETYVVKVVYRNPGVQVADSVFSDSIVVTVNPEPVELVDAVVTVNGTYTYTGAQQVIETSNVEVKIGDETLRLNEDYVFTSYGLNAGTGTVTVQGINGYRGLAVGSFEIAKVVTSQSDLTFGSTKSYNGAAQEFTVAPKGGLVGLGAITRVYAAVNEDGEYDTLPGAPTNVGRYVVFVSVAEGLNFTELETFEKPYNITQRVLDSTDFNYTIPAEHAWTGVAKPAVTATLKTGVIGYTKADSLKVTYVKDGSREFTSIPTDSGTYDVQVFVHGDANFAMRMVVLGRYVIHPEGWVGVLAANRDVPNSGKVEVAAIAPVKVVASGFTAGPSPVRNGEVIKFFSRSSVKSGSLYIFDRSGNSVAKVKASGSGEIGKWKVSNASEGSYVVKGVLIGKDGTKEKVSFVFAVTK